MTKEETINILKNAAWLGTNEDRKQTEEAVVKAIACINALDYIKDFMDAYANGLKVITMNESEVWKELLTLSHVKSFIKGYEKGIFDGEE